MDESRLAARCSSILPLDLVADDPGQSRLDGAVVPRAPPVRLVSAGQRVFDAAAAGRSRVAIVPTDRQVTTLMSATTSRVEVSPARR